MKSLAVNNLSFNYKGCQRTLDGLSLKLERGEKLFVLGLPGSGKTTFLRCLAGFLPAFVKGDIEGSAVFEGKELLNADTQSSLGTLSLVGQNPEEQFLCTTVSDELACAFGNQGMPVQKLGELVDWGLAAYDLEKQRNQDLLSLSGGQKRRVLLAIDAMLGCPLRLYDSFYDGLDEKWKAIATRSIIESDATCICMSSRIDQSARLFSSFALLKDGKLTRVPDFQSLEARVDLSIQPGLQRRQREPVMLQASDLEISYRGGFDLKVPSLRVRTGETVGLFGENGSGKTSLARVLCGLDKVRSGKVICESRIGYLLQNPDYQIFLPTVMDELCYPSKPARLSRARKARVEEALKAFGLAPDAIATMLPPSSRKALQAAVYYVLDRPICILDELEASLDFQSAMRMLRLLESTGAGILLITHDKALQSLCSRVYQIEDGIVKEVVHEA